MAKLSVGLQDGSEQNVHGVFLFFFGAVHLITNISETDRFRYGEWARIVGNEQQYGRRDRFIGPNRHQPKNEGKANFQAELGTLLIAVAKDQALLLLNEEMPDCVFVPNEANA